MGSAFVASSIIMAIVAAGFGNIAITCVLMKGMGTVGVVTLI
jgi:energy-converting hydrogenase Eha subunit C